MEGLSDFGYASAQDWKPTRVVTKSTGVTDERMQGFRLNIVLAIHWLRLCLSGIELSARMKVQ
jgi:hypothetical protein